MKDVKLYINKELVELGSNPSLPITLQLDDISNPGSIKNDWSKTILLPSTTQNDKVLDHLYKVDRVTTDFNVSKKIPFELTVNDVRFKIGYVRFGNVTIDRTGHKVYELNLLGELGNFFYDLGEKKMVDLQYDLVGNPTLSHTINAQYIKDNWRTNGYHTSGIHTYLSYIPMFQGEYEDFDSNLKISNGVGYDVEPVDMGISYDEWGLQCFSSTRQKPALNIYRTINSILSGMSGYIIQNSIEYIGKYYSDCWMTCKNYEENVLSNTYEFMGSYYSDLVQFTITQFSNNYKWLSDYAIDDSKIGMINGTSVNFPNTGIYSRLSIDGKFYFKCNVEMSYLNSSGEEVYAIGWSGLSGIIFKTHDGTSPFKFVGSTLTSDGTVYTSPVTPKLTFTDSTIRILIPHATEGVPTGKLQQFRNGIWNDDIEYSYEKYEIEFLTKGIDFNLWLFEQSGLLGSGHDALQTYKVSDNSLTLDPNYMTKMTFYKSGTHPFTTYELYYKLRNLKNILDEKLTQKDFLLEFCRQYGLYITVKDKVVRIEPRDTFYDKETLDWNTKLDLSKNIIVNPIAFDKKKIIVGYKENTETNFLKTYNESTGYNYSDAVADTGWEITNDELRILDKNIFNPITLVKQNIYRGGSGAYLHPLTLPSSFDIEDAIKRVNVKNSMSFLFRVGDTFPTIGPKFGGDDYGSYVIFDDTNKMMRDKKYYYNLNYSNGAYVPFNNTIPLYSTRVGTSSLDFRKPLVYWEDTDPTYLQEYTIYDKFWKFFIQDRYNINTKIMTAYFNLTESDVNKLTLGEFIYLNGVYWTINKVTDFDPTNNNTTKVELISVQDLENYRNGQTLISAPVSNTGSVYGLSYTSFTVSNSTSLYDGIVLERGLFYSTSSNVNEFSTKIVGSGVQTGSYNINLSNLTDNVTYYFRSYIKTNAGYTFGSILNTTTLDITVPTISLINVINGDIDSVQANAYITSENGSTLTERGIVYSTTTNPTTSNIKIAHPQVALNGYMLELTGLNFNTTYYIKAYAINGQGTSYSNELTYLYTVAPPTTSIGYLGTVNYTTIDILSSESYYESTILEKGIFYSTSSNVNESSSKKIHASTEVGSYNITLDNLADNTTFYFRSYVRYSVGYVLGSNTLNATTLDITIPSLTIINTTEGDIDSVQVNANISNANGSTITEQGIVYSTSSNPTTADTKLTYTPIGLGNFDVTTNLLSYNTTYYLRAYATNGQGTAYSNQVTYLYTVVVPTVTTQAVTDPSTSQPKGNGTVTSNGGMVLTERGYVYSTSPNPTLSNSKVVEGYNTEGVMEPTILTNLTAGTWYVRAYATNGAGTGYGSDVSFTAVTLALGDTYLDGLVGYLDGNGGGFVWKYPYLDPSRTLDDALIDPDNGLYTGDWLVPDYTQLLALYNNRIAASGQSGNLPASGKRMSSTIEGVYPTELVKCINFTTGDVNAIILYPGDGAKNFAIRLF